MKAKKKAVAQRPFDDIFKELFSKIELKNYVLFAKFNNKHGKVFFINVSIVGFSKKALRGGK